MDSSCGAQMNLWAGSLPRWLMPAHCGRTCSLKLKVTHNDVEMLSLASLAVQVHAKVGNAVKKQLPPGLNPKILEQLEASFGGPPGRAASPPVPAVAKRVSGGSTPNQASAPVPAQRNTAPAAAQSAG